MLLLSPAAHKYPPPSPGSAAQPPFTPEVTFWKSFPHLRTSLLWLSGQLPLKSPALGMCACIIHVHVLRVEAFLQGGASALWRAGRTDDCNPTSVVMKTTCPGGG